MKYINVMFNFLVLNVSTFPRVLFRLFETKIFRLRNWQILVENILQRRMNPTKYLYRKIFSSLIYLQKMQIFFFRLCLTFQFRRIKRIFKYESRWSVCADLYYFVHESTYSIFLTISSLYYLRNRVNRNSSSLNQLWPALLASLTKPRPILLIWHNCSVLLAINRRSRCV